MVFIHGGAYGWGGTADPLYDGHNFVAAHPEIVLVTIAYRIGLAGFMDFSEVPGGESYRTSGNLGILDQICALAAVIFAAAAAGVCLAGILLWAILGRGKTGGGDESAPVTAGLTKAKRT